MEMIFLSLISIVATNEFVSLTGDGRGMSAVQENEILTENIQKVYKVNERIMVGFAGSDTVREIVVNNLGTFSDENAQRFAQTLFAVIGNGKSNKEFFCLIGGLDGNRNIYFAVFQDDSDELIEMSPQRNQFLAFCNSTDNTAPHNPQEMLRSLINEHCQINRSLNIEDCRDVQARFNEVISNIDGTVNENILNFQIIRG